MESKADMIEQLQSTWRKIRTVGQQRDDLARRLMGINPSDVRCLEALDGGDEPVSGLAQRCGLTPSAMTAVVDRLVRRGLVSRREDPDDRRRILIGRTPAADRIRADLFGQVAIESRLRLREFTTAELSVIERYLRHELELTTRHHEDLERRGGRR